MIIKINAMPLFSRLFKPKPHRFIPVYYVVGNHHGNVMSAPIGKMPRLSPAEEAQLARGHCPAEGDYISTQHHGADVILLWQQGGVEAACYMRSADAERARGYEAISAESLETLSPGLRHFPRL